MPYRFYKLDDPYLKEYNNRTWHKSKYANKTETRDFNPQQVQFCVLRRHSDTEMELSQMALDDLKSDIIEKQNHPVGHDSLNISLQFEYHFLRA